MFKGEKDPNFTGADTRNGMSGYCGCQAPRSDFEGQTKRQLASAECHKSSILPSYPEICCGIHFDRNLETLKAIIGCAEEKSAKIRKGRGKG